MADYNSSGENNSVRRIAEISLRIALLFLLLYWCYNIIKPFLDILLWSVIFAVAIFPLYTGLYRRIGGRKKLAATIIIAIMLIIMILPGLIFAKSLYEGVAYLKTQYESAGNIIPEASESIKSWPFAGQFLYEKWNWISQNVGEALKEYSPQIKQALVGFFSSVAAAGGAFLKLIISIIIAGFLLIASDKAAILSQDVFTKLLGEKGPEFASMAERTIRTVIKGIVGVAFIQSILFGIGMIIAGVPLAGLWVILSLILGIIQIGIFPISIPVIIYVFATKSTFVAIIFLIWAGLVSPIDNILKPIFLGQGATVPMPVIFLGSIGGFIVSGLAGLFTGAIIFSVAYKLFQFWIEEIER
jgi:predicted PurR-regulated permease PerM